MQETKTVCFVLGDAVGTPTFVIRYTTLRGSRSFSKHIRPAIIRLVRRKGNKPKSDDFFLDSPMLYNSTKKRWFNREECWRWFDQSKNKNKAFKYFDYDLEAGEFVEVA